MQNLDPGHNLHGIFLNLVAFIRLNLFVKTDLQIWLDKPIQEHIEIPPKTIKGKAGKAASLFAECIV
jgi:hypothetical protein